MPAMFEAFFRVFSSIIPWRQRKSSWSRRSYCHFEERVDMAASAVHDDGEETDAEKLGQKEECSAEFLKLFVHSKMHGKLSAKDESILSNWARGAGVQGKRASLTVKPSRAGGGFSEKFDAVLASSKPFKVISVTCQSFDCCAILWTHATARSCTKT